jgi:hypothetical protein
MDDSKLLGIIVPRLARAGALYSLDPFRGKLHCETRRHKSAHPIRRYIGRGRRGFSAASGV